MYDRYVEACEAGVQMGCDLAQEYILGAIILGCIGVASVILGAMAVRCFGGDKHGNQTVGGNHEQN